MTLTGYTFSVVITEVDWKRHCFMLESWMLVKQHLEVSHTTKFAPNEFTPTLTQLVITNAPISVKLAGEGGGGA